MAALVRCGRHRLPERRGVFADQHDGLALARWRGRPRRGQRSLLRAASPPGRNGVPQLSSNTMLLPDVPQPPAAPRRAGAHVAHGDIRPDDWQWLANRDDPEVIAYLEAENAYTDAVLAPTDAAPGTPVRPDPVPGGRDGHLDPGVPRWLVVLVPHPGRDSSTPSTAGEPTRARALSVTEVLAAARAALPGAGVAGDGTPPPVGDGRPMENVRPHPGEVVLDENELAGSGDYFALGVFDIRPDHEVLAYAVDRDGSERYRLRFRDLGSGDDLADVVEDVYYGSAWSRSWQELLLRPARQGHAPVASVAARPGHAGRPRPTGVPGGRRTVFRLGRT